MDLLQFSFKSRALQKVQQQVQSLVGLDCAVAIFGSAGSGKSVWALELAKKHGHFVAIEASSAPKTYKDWKAFFSQSSTQSVIFENIDKWSEATQNSLAHFIKTENKVSPRLISTAHGRIHSLVSSGDFRADLFYKLVIRSVELPDVKDCTEDIEQVAQFWLQVHSLVAGIKSPLLTIEASTKLTQQRWYGGWAEFVMTLERALTHKPKEILSEHIQFDSVMSDEASLRAGLTLAEMEKKLILQTLKITASNKSQAARILGISIRTLRNKLNEYKQESVHEFI